MREIVHVDMDAFYASVEQRDNFELRRRPVVVAWKGPRSVVCAASYEARKYGIRSAMPAVTAERLCPEAIFIPPDFSKYRAVSSSVREIFHRYTDLIEPLSLDEAYLDVTSSRRGLEVAQAIRRDIKTELSLTASAGLAPNKFLAKVASDWKKPDGFFQILPEQIEEFLAPLPLGRLPGVGKVTEERLAAFGLKTVHDVRIQGRALLESSLGRAGRRIFELASGIDESPVVSDRPTKSISAEDTFAVDRPLAEVSEAVEGLAERVWRSAESESRTARTVVLKLKTADFRILSRSQTPSDPPASFEEFLTIGLWLLEKVELDPLTSIRLVGIGLSNFESGMNQSAQPTLF